MSAETVRKQLSILLAGRWQVPLALAAAVTASLALYRLIPSTPPPDFDALLAALTVLQETQGAVTAADAIDRQLRTQARWTPAQQAVLHERLAGLLYAFEGSQAVHNPANMRRLLEHDRQARELGAPVSSRTSLRDGLAARWLGDEQAALDNLRAALPGDLLPDERRLALRTLTELLDGRPEARDEQRRLESELLDDDGLSPAYVWWSLHRAVREALDAGDVNHARELLAQHGDRLKTSDLRGYLDYLNAYVMLHEGRTAEAAPLARWVDEWLTDHTSSTHELDDFGHLPALNGWLSGRIQLADGKSPEALADFDTALAYQPGPELRAAIQLGRGVALGALGRHDAALAAFRAVAADVPALPAARQHATRTELHARLAELAGQQEAQAAYGSALPYLSLAAEVLPDDADDERLDLLAHFGQLCRVAADTAAGDQQRDWYHREAGRKLEQAASLARLDEPRLASLLWSAVEEYDRAGLIADAQRMLRQFVQGRAVHPQMPRALLQMGRTCEALGAPDEALDWYARVIAEYPRLEEAARAKELMAGVRVAQGPEQYPEAERLLMELVNDETIGPQAAVHRDALLAMCDLLYYQGRYGEAIGRLHDFLTLYPNDPERTRGEFAMADAYRRSAYALRADATGGSTESRERFHQAADLYDQLFTVLNPVEHPDEETQLYARLALFDRADCFLELNEPESLREALAIYRTAAARYEAQPAALTAHTQIANICLRLGQVPEAARALARARWILKTIPDEEFAAARSCNRAAWEQFLTLAAESDLLHVELTSACGPPPSSAQEP